MRIIFLFLLLTLILSSCAQDPWKAEQIRAQAESDATAAKSLQESLNQEQQRQHAEQWQQIQMQKEQMKLARRAALEPVKQWLIASILVVASIAVVYFVALGTYSTTRAYQETVVGISRAMIQAAEIRSRLIYLDDGRQFPAIVNLNMIADITTGAVTDTAHATPGNPQAITGAIANRHVGIVAKETRRAGKNSESVPLLQSPPIVDVKFSDVREYYNLVTQRKNGHDE